MKGVELLVCISHRNNSIIWIIKSFKRLFSSVFFSKLLTKLIFNVDVYPHSYHNCQNWDLTTLLLKKALNKIVKNNQKILEVGTGHLAILSTYIAKKRDATITAVDINPAFIENAIKNTEKNGVFINLIQSDLFSNVDGLFDIVVFNPPYVPTGWILRNNRELYTNSIFDLVWNGGSEGCDTIKHFLKEVTNVTHKDSIIILGVNTLFVDTSKMKKLIQDANLPLFSMVSSIGNPSKVYVIKKKSAGI